MRKIFLVTSALALLLMLGLFSGAASAANTGQAGATEVAAADDKTAPDEPRPIRIVGIVAEIHEGGIALRTRFGPVRVRVTENTTIMVPDNGECVEGSLEDITVGEPAFVAGVIARDRGILARFVAQCRPATE